MVDYDKVWKEDWKDITSYGPSYRTRYRLIKKMMRKHGLTRGSLLDAGCGEGTLLTSLKSEFPGLDLHGMDISRHATSKGSGLDLTVGDLTRKDTLPRAKFDIIICSEVLEHIEDYKAAVRNLSSLLRQGGHVIITSPYKMRHWTVHDDYAHHVRRWEDRELEEELEKNHVSVVESFTWGRVVYSLYYDMFLSRQDPRKLTSKRSFLKTAVVAPLLYRLFMIDDLFKKDGRTLVIVGKKV